jgi:predicted PurR-regulated permease PerM
VAATDFPGDASMAYWAIGLFIVVRLLDDFLYMPLTIGKSLHMHPLITVLMIFVGGAVAGITGLMLVLPLLGVVMVVGETIGAIVTDERLMARHRHARALRRAAASQDLHS